MKKLLPFLVALTLALNFSAQASPNPYNVGDPNLVEQRIAESKFTDFSSTMFLTRFGSILTEPIVRLIWAQQIITRSDWIGIQGLLGLANRISVGGRDDASNLFLYTCNRGWIDVGHVIFSAASYKLTLQALRGNGLSALWKLALDEEDDKLFNRIGWELRRGMLRVDKKTGKPLTEAFWAGYFTMRASMAVERGQNWFKRRKSIAQLPKAGNSTSAFTLEDLPSNYYGIEIGEKLARVHKMSTALKQFKKEFEKMLRDYGAVDFNNKLRGKNCPKTAYEMLKADAQYYKNLAESTQVPFNPKDSKDPKSPYNYTVYWKKTLNHDCLCDSKNRPIR